MGGPPSEELPMKKIYVLNVFVNWDTLPEYKCLPDLPTSFYEYEVEATSEQELYDTLADKLSDQYGFCINSIEYEILAIEVKLTKKMKLRYINMTYDEPEWISDFKGLMKYSWRFSYRPDTPEGEYDVTLYAIINGEYHQEDEVTKEYAEQIIGGSF